MRVLVVLLLILAVFQTDAQKQFTLEISCSPNLDASKFQFAIDNGVEMYKAIKPEIKGNRIILIDSFSAKYATIWVNYPVGKETKHYYSAFWVGEEPATMHIETIDSTYQYPVQATALQNVLDVSKEGEILMDEYIKDEYADYNNYFGKNFSTYKKNDSVAYILYERQAKLAKKQFDYLLKRPADYFSLWYFNKEIAVTPAVQSDSLVRYFNQLFTDTTAFSFERKRTLHSINTKPVFRNTIAPNFAVPDIDGKTLRLADMKGKSVLLIYWASWCGPCIEEIPTLKKIRSLFSVDQLEMISITKDETYPPYQKALELHQMNWRHVYGNNDIVNMYNVSSIPQVVFIDKNGYVKYFQVGYSPGKSDEFIEIVRANAEQ